MKLKIKHIPEEETYPLRIDILRNGQADNYRFAGDHDANTFHLGAFDFSKKESPECVGIASFLPNDFRGVPAYQLRGMAVSSEYRKKGIGSALLNEGMKILNDRGDCDFIWCNARLHAVKFYQKHGFRIQGEPFDIPGVGIHYLMYQEL